MLKFKYDDPEGYAGNEMWWASLSPGDEKYISMFFDGCNYDDHERVPFKAFYEKLVLYPDFDFKCCLELNCGDAQRIQIARELFLRNVFGCDDEDFREKWEEYGVTSYCQVVNTSKLPYENNSFDFVICELRKYGNNKEEILPVLNETFRVCCGYVYICGQYSESIPVEWWISESLKRNLLIHTQSRIHPNLVCVEGQIKWRNRNEA